MTATTFDQALVAGDETRLRQVATNLVANALQHTPDDAQVVVRVGRGRTGGSVPDGPPTAATGASLRPGAAVAVIEVADTGPGIAGRRRGPGLRAAVPRGSRRAQQHGRSGQHGGAGLGLSIVAWIVQAHGGRCELWTAPGEGARFRVSLPA